MPVIFISLETEDLQDAIEEMQIEANLAQFDQLFCQVRFLQKFLH